MDTPRDIVQSMSDQYDIISPMNNNKQTWYKWDYVCPYCDALIEVTALVDGHSIKSEICMKCLSPLALMSVAYATIYPITQPEEKEEQMELTPKSEELLYAPQAKITIVDSNGVNKSVTAREVSYALERNIDIHNYLNRDRDRVDNLTKLISDRFGDSNDQDTLTEIAEIFDIPLEREVEFTATITISGTINLKLSEDDFNLEDIIQDGLTVESYNFEVNDWTVDNVEGNG